MTRVRCHPKTCGYDCLGLGYCVRLATPPTDEEMLVAFRLHMEILKSDEAREADSYQAMALMLELRKFIDAHGWRLLTLANLGAEVRKHRLKKNIERQVKRPMTAP